MSAPTGPGAHPGPGAPGGPGAPIGRVPLGRTGLVVSRLGLGTSALGGVFGEVDEGDALRTVEAAFGVGITFFDTAPAYGATRSEQVLGRALRGVPRDAYVLATKVGKTTDASGRDAFDYSADGIRRSVDASARRLGVDVLDVVHLHDFEYEGGRHVAAALATGFPTLRQLRSEGRIRAVGAGIYPIDLWKRVLDEVDLDVALVHNHHTLVDVRAYELLPLAAARGVALVNAAPFASGLLTGGRPPAWHPAPAEVHPRFDEAARLAEAAGVPLPRLALAFARSEPRLPVTLFGCAHPDVLRRNVAWALEPVDPVLVARVQRVLEPVMNRQWTGGATDAAARGGAA